MTPTKQRERQELQVNDKDLMNHLTSTYVCAAQILATVRIESR